MHLGGYLGDLVVPHGSHSLPGLIAGSVAPAAEVEAKRPEGWHGWETCSESRSTDGVSRDDSSISKGWERKGRRGKGGDC